MGWNYRIGTEIYEYELGGEKNQERVFSIVSVYYDEDGNPEAYGGKIDGDYNNLLSHIPEMKELKGTFDFIQKAFEKPIIDLDNFPNEYENE